MQGGNASHHRCCPRGPSAVWRWGEDVDARPPVADGGTLIATIAGSHSDQLGDVCRGVVTCIVVVVASANKNSNALLPRILRSIVHGLSATKEATVTGCAIVDYGGSRTVVRDKLECERGCPDAEVPVAVAVHASSMDDGSLGRASCCAGGCNGHVGSMGMARSVRVFSLIRDRPTLVDSPGEFAIAPVDASVNDPDANSRSRRRILVCAIEG